METKNWYAVYTKSRNEKKVNELMTRNGYTVYLPLIKTLRQWSDRKKMVELPLIPSYVFVHVSEREYYRILETPGAIGYVTFEGKAAPIPEKQIEALKLALDKNVDIEISADTIEPGVLVKIISGPMKGAEGEMIRAIHKKNFLIRISHIGFSLKLEIDAKDVMKL
jgi:transcription antitermination factor NusG